MNGKTLILKSIDNPFVSRSALKKNRTLFIPIGNSCLWPCLIGFFFFFGCSSSTTFEHKEFEGLFSLDVESTMVDIGDHDPIASTEFGNDFKDFYFKVSHVSIEETRAKPMLGELSLNELHRLNVTQAESLYSMYMSSPTLLSTLDTAFNSMHCTIHDISTDGNGFPIRYKIAYFCSEKRLYQLHIWILEKRLDRFREGIDQMIYSFKEL